MMTGDTKAIEREAEFLDETLALAREVVTLRARLASAKLEHTELLEHREEALREGRDVLPRVQGLFLEIESLPVEMARIQERIHWIINQGVEKLNSENNQTAAQQYIKCRDNLRPALERVREVLASVLRDMRAGADLGPSLTDPHNSKLAQIEDILGRVHFPSVTYRPLPLPAIDVTRVSRGELLAAIDTWIAALC